MEKERKKEKRQINLWKWKKKVGADGDCVVCVPAMLPVPTVWYGGKNDEYFEGLNLNCVTTQTCAPSLPPALTDCVLSSNSFNLSEPDFSHL